MRDFFNIFVGEEQKVITDKKMSVNVFFFVVFELALIWFSKMFQYFLLKPDRVGGNWEGSPNWKLYKI